MKVLLTQTIERTGIVGEVIEVSNGFARNYLLPKGLAIQPTDGNIKRLEAARKEYEAKLQEIRAQKEKLVATLQGVEVTLIRNANDEGHLFGSVSKRDIAEELQKLGHKVEWWPEWTWMAGAVCTIVADQQTGVLKAGADPRRPSYAVGL